MSAARKRGDGKSRRARARRRGSSCRSSPAPPRWGSHTFTETHHHAVDALNGNAGCVVDDYLATHWEYEDLLAVRTVDVDDVDPGIQELP